MDWKVFWSSLSPAERVEALAAAPKSEDELRPGTWTEWFVNESKSQSLLEPGYEPCEFLRSSFEVCELVCRGDGDGCGSETIDPGPYRTRAEATEGLAAYRKYIARWKRRHAEHQWTSNGAEDRWDLDAAAEDTRQRRMPADTDMLRWTARAMSRRENDE
jgi:hypothetical protein